MKKIMLFERSLGGLAAAVGLMFVASANAADIRTFGVIKRGNFLQTDAVTTQPDSARPFEIVLFAEPDDVTSVNIAMVNPPSGTPIPLTDASNFTFTDSRSSQSQLNSFYGSGAYTFTFDTANDSTTVALLNVPADAYGPTPLISNFPGLQSVDATKNFNLEWPAFAGGTVADSIQVRILDDTNPVFESDTFGLPLDGTATSIAIFAGFLEPGKTYKGFLTFSKVANKDTTAYPGATGTVSFARQTQFPIKTTAGGSAGGPSLLFANPQDGATDVPVSSPIVFVFSTPMSPVQAIAWSGNNVNSANFHYSWAQPNTLLITYGALPGNTKISYTLNGFKDATGTPMPPVSGSFTTGAGSTNPNPCGTPSDDTKGSLSVFKSLNYLQTGPGAPILDTTGEMTVVFSASLFSPKDNPVVSGTVKGPTGQTVTLANTFGRLFSFFKGFSSQAALDADFPPGSYVGTVKRQNGTTQTINLALQAEPPVPHIANWSEANAFNSSVDSTLRWDPFAGAAQRDGISLGMHDQAGHTFSAPDPCVPRDLANTATSIVIPKNTFSATGDIDGSLTFSKVGSQDTSIADLSGFAGYSKMTGFKLRTGSIVNGGLRFNQPIVQANGSLQIGGTGKASSVQMIEVSTDLKTWKTFSTINLSAAGTGEVILPRSGPQMFLRGRSAQ